MTYSWPEVFELRVCLTQVTHQLNLSQPAESPMKCDLISIIWKKLHRNILKSRHLVCTFCMLYLESKTTGRRIIFVSDFMDSIWSGTCPGTAASWERSIVNGAQSCGLFAACYMSVSWWHIAQLVCKEMKTAVWQHFGCDIFLKVFADLIIVDLLCFLEHRKPSHPG